jgi:hypothetical protein
MVIRTDAAFANVKLVYRPRYSGRLRVFGRAIFAEFGLLGYTTIGRRSLISRAELIDTIIHEEVHHRLWLRGKRGAAAALRLLSDPSAEEDYVEAIASRFLKRKGL